MNYFTFFQVPALVEHALLKSAEHSRETPRHEMVKVACMAFGAQQYALRRQQKKRCRGALVDLDVNTGAETSLELTDEQALAIGCRIWLNECGGTVEGLTTWNDGEDFASMGIGHCIWYPEGRQGPYRESFKELVAYLKEQPGVAVPEWLARDPLNTACPWSSKLEFDEAKGSPAMTEIRDMLAATVPQQCRVLTRRMQSALPDMVRHAPPAKRHIIRRRFYQVAQEPMGFYALMDYTNFKGEGTKATERYRGKGWGLLQVLQSMGDAWTEGQKSATQAFVQAGKKVLRTRVANSPPERQEVRWLAGWSNRLDTYLDVADT